jgi:hypothetical protein
MRGSGTMRAPWQRLSAQAPIRQVTPETWSILSQAQSWDTRPGRLRRHPRA